MRLGSGKCCPIIFYDKRVSTFLIFLENVIIGQMPCAATKLSYSEKKRSNPLDNFQNIIGLGAYEELAIRPENNSNLKLEFLF